MFKKKTILELHHDLSMESRIVKFLVKNTNFLNFSSLIKLIAITENVKVEFIKKYNLDKKKVIVLPSGSSINQNFLKPKIKKNSILVIWDLL